MAKFHVEAAYRNVPVHPSHRVLLGMKWHDQFYVDLVLPFGLRSASFTFIFNSIADMVEWILVNSYQIPDLLHYLDDFITAGPAQSPQCAQNLATACKSVIGSVYLCIPASVLALLQCLLSWGLSLTLSTKWRDFPKRSCHCCKS